MCLDHAFRTLARKLSAASLGASLVAVLLAGHAMAQQADSQTAPTAYYPGSPACLPVLDHTRSGDSAQR